jgi:serine/threonine protein kinase
LKIRIDCYFHCKKYIRTKKTVKRNEPKMTSQERKLPEIPENIVSANLYKTEPSKRWPKILKECIFYGRYLMIRAIGNGAFGVTWLALDMQTNEYVAVKVNRSEQTVAEAAIDEHKILSHLASDPNTKNCVVIPLDFFSERIDGAFHVCVVLELMAATLLDKIVQTGYKGLQLRDVQRMARQLLRALAQIHGLGIVHTDIKPENIMVDEHGIARIIDFGNAQFLKKRITNNVCTRQYTPPEVILGWHWDEGIDVFSLACCLFELVCGDLLFDPKDPPMEHANAFTKDDDHLALMMELLGNMPDNLRFEGKKSQRYYDRTTGELRLIKNLERWPLGSVLADKYKLPPVEAKALADFLEPMLCLNPEARATAEQMLNHPWLTREFTVGSVPECLQAFKKTKEDDPATSVASVTAAFASATFASATFATFTTPEDTVASATATAVPQSP